MDVVVRPVSLFDPLTLPNGAVLMNRISKAATTMYGTTAPKARAGIAFHWRTQSVVNVSEDGRSANLRTRLFHPDTGKLGNALGGRGGAAIMSGMYPNDQAVLEKGVWKLWSVAIDEFYYNSAGYRNGWTKVPADPAEKVPDMLIKAYPPDIPLTAMGRRQQGYIPGSTQFNPYVHNGPAYPGYPSATPMWFHYANPVSGRMPPYYWPDCASCTVLAGVSVVAALLVPFRKWMCCGSCCWVIVTALEPAFSPRVWPSPIWIGTRPRRSGSWKVVCPLPP